MKQEHVELKRFKVIDEFGDETFTDGPSKQSVLEDLQRMGVLSSKTIVEEVTEEQEAESKLQQNQKKVAEQYFKKPEGAKPKFFTMPGGKKIKDLDGQLFSLEWVEMTPRQVIERMGVENVKFPEGHDVMEVLDWVELEQEGDEDASKTDSDV